MYRKQISQKASPSLRSTPTSKEIAPSPSYGSLSSVVQRVQQNPNSVSEDERKQLENAIGTRSTQEILAGQQSSWTPKFQGISAQLWGDSGQVGAPIQTKRKDDVGVSEVQPKNKTGLPDNLKAGIENLSGMAMDDVRVHYNSSKPAELQALAYTQGTEIHVAPGQEEHLPHEAWHVVQQMQGRVKPTMQIKGVQINGNEGLEKEADVMGVKASGGAAQHQYPAESEENSLGLQTASLHLPVQAMMATSVVQLRPITNRMKTNMQNALVRVFGGTRGDWGIDQDSGTTFSDGSPHFTTGHHGVRVTDNRNGTVYICDFHNDGAYYTRTTQTIYA